MWASTSIMDSCECLRVTVLSCLKDRAGGIEEASASSKAGREREGAGRPL